MSGQWWESNLIVGPFSNITEANAWAAANPSSLFLGLLATINGQQISWGAAGWGAPPGAWVYVGATLPALGAYIGQLIQVDNSAVPSGRSILRWNGAIWAPPAGELIAAAASSTPGPLALVTPGVTTLTQIWASEVIPDYMIPELLEFEIDANLGVKNPSPVAGSVVGVGISGVIPTGTSQCNYPASFFCTHGTTYFAGIGSAWTGKRAQAIRHFGAFKHPDPYTTEGSSSRDANTCGDFVSGSNRVYAMAKPSSVSDQVRFDCVQVYSKGNL